MTPEANGPRVDKSSRWSILCHRWAGVCLYAAVNVGTQRLGLRMGAIPAVLIVVAGYYGSRALFVLIGKLAISTAAKMVLRIVLTIGYFPVAIPVAMLIAQLR